MATKKNANVDVKDPEKSVDVPPYGSRNPDPISDQPGSHPVETGIGAAVGGIASGAAIGAVGGPVGAVIGGIVGGAIGGGLAGKGVGELIDPTTEDNWLREYHDSDAHRAHVSTATNRVDNSTYETYRPAYRYGLDASRSYHENLSAGTTGTAARTGTTSGSATARRFEDVEHDLRSGWEKAKDRANLSWDQAKGAVRHAFDRANQSVQLKEEQLRVGKEQVRAGEVGIRKEVVTEHKTVQVPVEREEVVIERRPVSGAAAAGDIRAEEIRIPVKEERVHVSKEAVVTEEVSVGKRKVRETETVGADLKKEQVKVEQTGDVRVRGDVTTTKDKR
jgi:uncharacterized protein (TIGR02271 family)